MNAYGHIVEELDDAPSISAEDAIGQGASRAECSDGMSDRDAPIDDFPANPKWVVPDSNRRPPACKAYQTTPAKAGIHRRFQ